jgi:transmembrane sensor
MDENKKMTYVDILMDDRFVAFMKEEDEKKLPYWAKAAEEDPDTKKEYDKAVSVYKILTGHKKVKYTDSIKDKAVNRLISLIDASDSEKAGKSSKYSLGYISTIAAAAAVLIGLGWFMGKSTGIFNHGNKNVYHEIIVPSGEKSQVLLSDGTKIWLNSESKLRYPGRYSNSKRAVFLEGEGYFEVSKQNGSNFTVYTQEIKVEALGTKFNIKSYPEDKTIETTLVEGSVKVEHSGSKNKFPNVILKPNERFVYRKFASNDEVHETEDNRKSSPAKFTVRPRQISVTKVNTENITCWKDYLLVFDNETLEEIAVKMSRWYKVKVNILDDDLKTHRFTGKFINNETIFNVLEAIDLTTPIEYTMVDNEVNIGFDKTRKEPE